MTVTPFSIENDSRRVLFHPRANGEVTVCFLDKIKDLHKHKIFKNMDFATAMGRNWCGVVENHSNVIGLNTYASQNLS